MATLTITDLPRVDALSRDAMTTLCGGIMYMTNPDTKNAIPGIPTSWPGAAILKDLHLPASWPTSPERPAQDPRLL